MARAFSLVGLLRLRHIQQDEAASELAAANARLRETSARRAKARATLDDGTNGGAIVDSTTLLAVAAARASARSMLAELDAVVAEHRAVVERAQGTYNAARAQSIGLEKLEGKHVSVVAEEDVRGEQLVLDEIASTAWNRGQGASR